MEPDEVRNLYEGYAEVYDSTWYEHEKWHEEGEHHIETLRGLLAEGTRWLDVGCGTGYLMSHFPGVARAGLDLTPGMLTQARAANPDILELREGDFRDDVLEWHEAWDLVSCTGQVWSYLRDLAEVEQVVANLAGWTAPGGACFLPVHDLTDFVGLRLPYPPLGSVPEPETTPIITGVFWWHVDVAGQHRHILAPMMGFWLECFAEHFRRVEIGYWPKLDFVPIRRRYIVCARQAGAGRYLARHRRGSGTGRGPRGSARVTDTAGGDDSAGLGAGADFGVGSAETASTS